MYACILVRTLPGKLKTVLDGIKALEKVVRVFPVYGRYDIVTFVEVPDFKSLSEVSREINALRGIKSTETAVEG